MKPETIRTTTAKRETANVCSVHEAKVKSFNMLSNPSPPPAASIHIIKMLGGHTAHITFFKLHFEMLKHKLFSINMMMRCTRRHKEGQINSRNVSHT